MTTLTTRLRENRSPSSSGPLLVVMVSRQPWAVVTLIHYLGRQQHRRYTNMVVRGVDMLGCHTDVVYYNQDLCDAQ